MVISHRYRYLYVELDRTASTVIARELCENYDGKRILWKRARYRDFLKTATLEEKNYFTFSGVRNPLDILVSLYCRHKNEHKGKLLKDTYPANRNIVK